MTADSLASKNVLVIGGGTGIGRGIARAFDSVGCSVAICGRRPKKLEEAIAGTGMKAKPCDATDRVAVEELFSWFAGEIGQVDILVYCAGINIPKRTFADMDPEEFEEVMNINVTGAFHCIQVALAGMRERGGGQIFNVISLAGIQNIQLAGVPYTASKVAQTALGTFANLEALPDGVRITNVYPGETNTPLLDERPVPPPAEKRARMVHPEDIAELLLAVSKLPSRAVVPELVITPTHMPRY